MYRLVQVRNYSTRFNTWCYQQGYYQYDKENKKSKYQPLIFKFRAGVITEEMAKKYRATWDKDEKVWVILRGTRQRLPLPQGDLN